MTVRDLMKVLMSYNLDLEVAYSCHSEYCTLEENDLRTEELGEKREDGWIARKRSDAPTKVYLIFPGN